MRLLVFYKIFIPKKTNSNSTFYILYSNNIINIYKYILQNRLVLGIEILTAIYNNGG